jgi:hypothetical protein
VSFFQFNIITLKQGIIIPGMLKAGSYNYIDRLSLVLFYACIYPPLEGVNIASNVGHLND